MAVSPLRVGLGPVELGEHLGALGFVARRQGQDRGRAAVLSNLGGKGFQRRRVFIGQQVGAIA